MLLIILNLKKKKKESLWQESLEPVWEGRCLASAMREKTPPPACLCLWNSGCVHAFAYF